MARAPLLVCVVAALCVLVAAQTLTPAQQIARCKSTFDTSFAAATTSAIRCTAYTTLDRCLTGVVAASPRTADTTTRAQAAISAAIGVNTDCDLSTVPYLTNLSGGDSLAVNVAAGESVSFTNMGFSGTNMFDVESRLDTLQDKTATLIQQLTASGAETLSTIQARSGKWASAIDALNDPGLAALQSRLDTLSTLVASLKNSVSGSFSASVSTARVAPTATLTAETSSRLVAQAALSSMLATLQSSISTQASTAAADRAAIRSSMTSPTLSASVSAMLSSALVTENARAVQESTDEANTISSYSTAQSTALSTAMASEYSRQVSNCGAAFAANFYMLQVQSGTTKDYAACTTSGDMYYSSGNKRIFQCDGTRYKPFVYDSYPFAGSKIFTTTNGYGPKMQRVLGTPAYLWKPCYVASVHGFSASTFHQRCNFMGPTLMIVKTTTNYIFGGYTPFPWQSTDNWIPLYTSFLYRFTSGGVPELAYPFNSPSNAIYDSSGNLSQWGSGTDLYIDSSGQNGYTTTCCFAYWNGYNYGAYWLHPPSTGFQPAEIEFWYQYLS